MKISNLHAVAASNLRMNAERTLLPTALLLCVISLIYGTSNLDGQKSADCLERMAALIGLPMFVPLLRPEQISDMGDLLALRPFPQWMIALLRMGLSLLGAAALILAFELWMRLNGCGFPLAAYALRTLAAAATLGWLGLLVSALSGKTIAGFLAAFCWYIFLQSAPVGGAFRPVTNGIDLWQGLLLPGCGAAILCFCVRSSGAGARAA